MKLTPAFLIILNLILKVIFISSNSIAVDEPFSIYHAQLDTSSIIEMLYGENNPPLHFFFLHYWIKAFGISTFSVRIPSLIFSTCTVYFIYKIGQSFFNYRIALIASLLFTFSNYHVVFSHEARVYPLFALLTSISMFYFLKICNKDSSFKNYLYLLIVNSLLLYSHYLGFFVIFIQVLTTLLLKETRPLWKKNALYLGALFITYIPYLHILIIRFLESTSRSNWVKPPSGVASLYNMLWQFSNQPLTTVVSIVILISALTKYIVKKDFKIKSTNTVIITLWFVFPFLFMFFISFWISIFLDRYLIFVSLGFYLVLSICCTYIFSQVKYNLILPSILVLLFFFTFNPKVDNKRHVKEAVEKVKELKDNRTMVLICPLPFIYNFAYYYNPEIFKKITNEAPYYQATQNLMEQQNIYLVNNLDDTNITDWNRVVLFDTAPQSSFHKHNIMDVLKKTYKLKNNYKFHETFNVYEFVKE